jgi:hypothetical protein
LTSVPLKDLPIAVRTAPTITGVPMFSTSLSGYLVWLIGRANRIKYCIDNSIGLSSLRAGL